MERPVVTSYAELVTFVERLAEHLDEYAHLNDKPVEGYVRDLAAAVRGLGGQVPPGAAGLTWQQIADALYDAT